MEKIRNLFKPQYRIFRKINYLCADYDYCVQKRIGPFWKTVSIEIDEDMAEDVKRRLEAKYGVL